MREKGSRAPVGLPSIYTAGLLTLKLIYKLFLSYKDQSVRLPLMTYLGFMFTIINKSTACARELCYDKIQGFFKFYTEGHR